MESSRAESSLVELTRVESSRDELNWVEFQMEEMELVMHLVRFLFLDICLCTHYFSTYSIFFVSISKCVHEPLFLGGVPFAVR